MQHAPQQIITVIKPIREHMAGRLHSGPEASFSSSPSSYSSSSCSPLSPDGRGGLTGESVNEEKEPITRAQLRINVISCWRSLERPRRLRPETNQDQCEPFPFSYPLLLNLSPSFFPLLPLPSFGPVSSKNICVPALSGLFW